MPGEQATLHEEANGIGGILCRDHVRSGGSGGEREGGAEMSEPREHAPDKAARLGMELVEPKPDEVFVDLDGEAALDEFLCRWNNFIAVYPLSTVQFTTSKSGNYHAYVRVPDLSPLRTEERIAMQAALGSDPLREMIALEHHRDGYEYPCVFFEMPGTVRRDTPRIAAAVEVGGA